MRCDHVDADSDVLLLSLTRPQRLFLKRAYASSERTPFFPPTSTGAGYQVMARMIEKGFARSVGHGAVLTGAGHDCAALLSRLGWPDCEKPKTPPHKR